MNVYTVKKTIITIIVIRLQNVKELTIKILSPHGVHSKITRRPTMKHLTDFAEATIILFFAVLIVLPEIAYSLVLRARDKAVEMWGEL